MPFYGPPLVRPRVNEAPELACSLCFCFLLHLLHIKPRHATRFLKHKATWRVILRTSSPLLPVSAKLMTTQRDHVEIDVGHEGTHVRYEKYTPNCATRSATGSYREASLFVYIALRMYTKQPRLKRERLRKSLRTKEHRGLSLLDA
jgi:hypothetical protein